MNLTFKKLFSLTILLGITAISADSSSVFGKTFFNQRPVGSDTADEMVGVMHLINRCDMDCIYGAFWVKPEYRRNFDRDEIGKYLFFNGTNSMTFGPSNGAGIDVFARNFFLNDDFQGTVTAKPSVQNVVVDFNLYIEFAEWVPGLYFRIHAPINWTKWNVDLEETAIAAGTTIAANELGNTVAAASPLTNIIDAWNGQTLLPATFPDLKETLGFARINGAQSKTRLADVEIALGYNFICNECAYLGLNLRTVFPTGNRPAGVFFFEPIAGNGHHYQVGAGLSGYYELWNNCYSSFGVYLDANVYHVFKARQTRTFDLTANGVGSRYLLLKKFNPDGTFSGEVLFGPNVLTRKCNARNDIQTDLSLMFDYQHCGWTFDIGYNFWARTKDKISDIEPIDLNTFGVKGVTLTAGGTANQTGSTGTTIKGDGATPDTTNIFITVDSLDKSSAEQPTSISHGVFGNVGYTWDECDYMPFFGLGGKVEFSGNKNTALDQFSVWVKGGFSFS